jgi:hypothetical protein
MCRAGRESGRLNVVSAAVYDPLETGEVYRFYAKFLWDSWRAAGGPASQLTIALGLERLACDRTSDIKAIGWFRCRVIR